MINLNNYNGPTSINTYKDLHKAGLACGIMGDPQEHLILATLDGDQITGLFEISKESALKYDPDYKELFGILEQQDCKDFVLIRNRENGNQWPSEPEMQAARRLDSACEARDIYLRDFGLIGGEDWRFCSMRAHGIFEPGFDDMEEGEREGELEILQAFEIGYRKVHELEQKYWK